MNNQKGEVVLGLMIVMMAAMMFLGGMHLTHSGHCNGGDHRQHDQKHELLDDGMQHPNHGAGEQANAPEQGNDK